jgi:hypothetical protein
MKKNAYWISPSGSIIPVDAMHISTIIEYPKKFNMTKKQIEDIYADHNESIGIEGHAREEIMTMLLNKGWIRLRYNSRQDMWVAQTKEFGKRQKDYMFDWATSKDIKTQKYSEVMLMSFKPPYNIGHTVSIDDIQKFTAFEGWTIRNKEYIAKIVMIEDFEPNSIDLIG